MEQKKYILKKDCILNGDFLGGDREDLIQIKDSPRLLKGLKVQGKKIVLRNATVSDAEFILSLRTDYKKSMFLSKTDDNLLAQREWLHNYSKSCDQAYFIIVDNNGENIGTVRLYDQKNNSFCWGSWILSDSSHNSAAIESALLVYIYAIVLGFRCAHFDVRKGNLSVSKFHENFGAVIKSETETDYLYVINMESIISSIKKYSKYLPEEIVIEF